MIYNLNDLKKACESGEKFKFLFFWGHTSAADGHINETCLSQWWSCHFQVEDVEYSCAEQYMMAEKARMFGDQEMLACIMGTSYPKEMKAYGRAVAGFDKDTWEKECYEIVKRGNKAKFSQNPDAQDPLKWRGTNLLGFALTEVRDLLTKERGDAT